MPARTAARVGSSPAAPTIAAMTISHVAAATAAASASIAALHARREPLLAAPARACAAAAGIDQNHDVGPESPRLLDDGFPAAVGAQHGDPKALADAAR